MKIDKAIELLNTTIKTLPATLRDDEKDAVRLGIEALKRIKDDRRINPDLNPYPLPGED